VDRVAGRDRSRDQSTQKIAGQRPFPENSGGGFCRGGAVTPSLDPFTGEILNFYRGRYRPTRAQQEYLAVTDVTCGTSGWERLAMTLCETDHRLKTLTKG